jgi:hypothetical protein
MDELRECPMAFGSHGCRLAPGHEGDHCCLEWGGHDNGWEVCFAWPPGKQGEFDVREDLEIRLGLHVR